MPCDDAGRGRIHTVKTENGKAHRFHYAETFIIPAAAGKYELINMENRMARVIKAFIK